MSWPRVMRMGGRSKSRCNLTSPNCGSGGSSSSVERLVRSRRRRRGIGGKSSVLCAINRALFDRASELLLAQPDSGSRQTWILLDELPQRGPLDGLDDLLSMSRSRAVSVALGFQDVERLRDIRQLSGEHLTQAMLGQCGNRAFLSLESPEICEWASRWFRERELVGVYEGYSGGESRNERSASQSSNERSQIASSLIQRTWIRRIVEKKKTSCDLRRFLIVESGTVAVTSHVGQALADERGNAIKQSHRVRFFSSRFFSSSAAPR